MSFLVEVCAPRQQFPGGSVVRNLPTIHEMQFDTRVRMIPWRRKWQSISVFLPVKFHGQRSLVGYSSSGYKKVRWPRGQNKSSKHHQGGSIPVNLKERVCVAKNSAGSDADNWGVSGRLQIHNCNGQRNACRVTKDTMKNWKHNVTQIWNYHWSLV